MVRIYTEKQYVKDKRVIYDSISYFDDAVLQAVRNGEYALTDSDRSLIANEGSILKVNKDVISTKYGDVSLKELSVETKIILLMRYLNATGDKSIVNVSNTGKAFERVLYEAERLETDVFWIAKYYSDDWFSDDMYALLNNGNIPVNLADTSIFQAFWSWGNKFNITNDTRIEFESSDAKYDLFFSASAIKLTVKDNMQKQKLWYDLKKAIANNAIKVTATRLDTYADVCDHNIQVLVVDDKNATDVIEKLNENKRPYITFCDDDSYVECLFGTQTENGPINEIAIRISEGDSTKNGGFSLVEEEIPASDESTARFLFSIQDNRLPVGKRVKLDFTDLQI